MLQVGQPAPLFALQDQKGVERRLSDFLGKRVVLYFYPKDATPGCTRQACAFREAFARFCALDVVVIGISKDSVPSHQRFAEKNGLPFLLLSDPEREAIEAYGVWQEKKSYGKTVMGVVRTTFLIDKAGRIEQIFEKVNPDTNAAGLLAYLEQK